MASVLERTIKGGAGFLVANVLSRGFSFLFVFVAGYLLGARQFGVLALGLSVLSVAQSAAAFGLPASVLRFLSGKGEADAHAVYGVIVTGAVVAALGVGAALYGSASILSVRVFSTPALIGPLRILALGLAVAVPYSVCHAVLQARVKVGSIIVVELVQHAGKVVMALAFFVLVPAVASFVWAVVGSMALSLGLGIRYVRRLDLKPAFRAARGQVRKVVRYAAPLATVGFSYLFALQADRLMLGALADASAVGVYTVAASLAMVTTALHSALVSVFMPIASEAYRKGARRDLQAAYLFVGKWVGIVNGILLIVYVGFGRQILGLFGAEYAGGSSYLVLLILTALYFGGTWVGPTGALLQMADGEKVELINTLVFVGANVALNYLLIPAYGILGAALATFFSGVLRNAMQVVEIYYWHDFSPITQRAVFFLVLVLAGAGGCLAIGAGSPARAVVSVLVALVVGGYALYRATPEERAMIARLKAKAMNTSR